MSDENKKRNETTRTLDLSTGKSGKKKVTAGMAAPIVQETINLSTPKEKKKAAPPGPEKPKKSTSEKRSPKNTSSRRESQPGGTSLAELLDPDTLAKLKGDA